MYFPPGNRVSSFLLPPAGSIHKPTRQAAGTCKARAAVRKVESIQVGGSSRSANLSLWQTQPRLHPQPRYRLHITNFPPAITTTVATTSQSVNLCIHTSRHTSLGHTVKMQFLSASSLLLAAAGLFSAVTAHNINLPAHGRECFHEVLHKDDKMTVSFQVGDREFGSAGNLEIDFWVWPLGQPPPPGLPYPNTKLPCSLSLEQL